jgi:hypothetical protein
MEMEMGMQRDATERLNSRRMGADCWERSDGMPYTKTRLRDGVRTYFPSVLSDGGDLRQSWLLTMALYFTCMVTVQYSTVHSIFS